MLLVSLSLQNFRSYRKQIFTFDPAITLIVGPNASGKTNILESIFMLATGKSVRADREGEIISWEEDISRIKGKTEEDELEIIVTPGAVSGQKTPRKKFLVNGVSRQMIDFVGKLPAVLFSPEDLNIVIGSPSIRRKYLDHVLIQGDREYRRMLTSYEKGLRQRNKLLALMSEGLARREQLFYWDTLLIKAGSYLTEKRAEFLEFVNTTGVEGAVYRVIYDKSVISEARLLQYKEEEVAAKATLVGPHRDDFIIKVKSDRITRGHPDEYRDLSSYGSRGEQRLGVLWLKLAELVFLEGKINIRPILLLDDIFSELDESHRYLVLSIVSTHQTLITSAERESIALVEEFTKKKHKVIELPREKG